MVSQNDYRNDLIFGVALSFMAGALFVASLIAITCSSLDIWVRLAQVGLTLIGIVIAIYGLTTWRRTLKNQRTDECLASIYAVVGLAHRCLSLKEEDAPPGKFWEAYGEAWNSHREFSSRWAILRRYPHQSDLAKEMPSRASDLLLEVGRILRGPDAETDKIDEITRALWNVRQDVEQRLPPP